MFANVDGNWEEERQPPETDKFTHHTVRKMKLNSNKGYMFDILLNTGTALKCILSIPPFK